MSKLDDVMQLHKDTHTKAQDMLASIKAIHGADAEMAMRTQYKLMTHLMNMTTALSATGMPAKMVLMMAEASRDIHREVLALAMCMAVSHIEDDDKALDATKELTGFVNQMGNNFTDALEKTLMMGDKP